VRAKLGPHDIRFAQPRPGEKLPPADAAAMVAVAIPP
jgi:hypothetical protein